MFEIGSWKWKFRMNEFSIITPENNLKFPYPIISVQFGTSATSSGGRDEKPLCYIDVESISGISKKNIQKIPCKVKY